MFKKSYKILVAKLLLVVFFIPMVFFVLHDLSNHQHEVCTSKIEKHIHNKDVDCTLHLVKQNHTFLKNNNHQFVSNFYIQQPDCLTYSFLPKHQQLSFSLRAPPAVL